MADTTTPTTYGGQQFGRYLSLIVFNNTYEGKDLSQLHVKFSIKHTGVLTPNMAEIRVYNVDVQVALRIQQEFKSVVLLAGYQSGYGKIFSGTIVQVILGKEDATTNYIDIIAGDGDLAYNFATVNQPISAPCNAQQIATYAINAMTAVDPSILAGYSDLSLVTTALPRGKVLYGAAKDILKQIGQSTNRNITIRDGLVIILDKKTYLNAPITVLTCKTGLIGIPQQTSAGVNIKCLLNANLKPFLRVQINNKGVTALKIDLSQQNSAANFVPSLSEDGTYYILAAEFQGDTRGQEWYTNLICSTLDPDANPADAIQIG